MNIKDLKITRRILLPIRNTWKTWQDPTKALISIRNDRGTKWYHLEVCIMNSKRHNELYMKSSHEKVWQRDG